MITALLMLAIGAGPVQEPGAAPSSAQMPAAIAGLAFDQRPNAQVPLDATFLDEQGRMVRLADLFRGRPVILVPAYYRCPQLCNLVLNGLLDGLRGVTYRPGEEYTVVAISFDPRETPEIAAAKKANYVDGFGRPGAAENWHFLTGDKKQIDRVMDAVGFRYAFDEKHDRFNHPSGIVIVTPQGNVSRYLFGIHFPPRDLKLGLMEASAGQVGSVVDQFLLFCFHYDQNQGKYGFAVMNAVRLAGALTVLLIVAGVVRLLRRESASRLSNSARQSEATT
jgi:protein SCO1/2